MLIGLALAGAVGCATGGLRRFPMREPTWQDPDRRPYRPRPETFYSPYVWDGVENTFFRPVSEFWLLEQTTPAPNVNAMDEVPDSSWFTNRIGRRRMSPTQVALGACADREDPVPRPWTVVGGKPDGANPGFQIEDAEGTRYLLKTDGDLQNERPSAADVIGAAIYWSAGYYAPCNRVVTFRRDDLELDPTAEVERTNGSVEEMTQDHIAEVLDKATSYGEGVYRASVSQFIEGRPISPWRYEGTRQDDPNDVIPHQDRRELRGMYVFAALTDHIDSRQENTLAAWMSLGDDGYGFVRHYMIDFGDCFGILYVVPELPPRFGHAGYVDLEQILVDFVTLGIPDRPWHHASFGPAGRELGYYDARRFDADAWRTGYPNKAFTSKAEGDAAWAARILARFRDPHIDALAARGRWSEPVVERELARILKGRRDKLLDRYLTRLSPLTEPTLRTGGGGGDDDGGGPRLCMEDLATRTDIRPRETRRYEARLFVGDRFDERGIASPTVDRDGRVCVAVPPFPEASVGAPAYLVVSVGARSTDRPGEDTGPALVHLYATGPRTLQVVGLERPEKGPPR